MKKIPIIKPISLILIVTLLWENIAWANPEVLQKDAISNTLQVQSKFNPLENPELLHKSLIELPLKYIVESTDIEKFNYRLSPPIYKGINLVLDFSKKQKEDNNWIVPCSIADTKSRDHREYEAVISPDKSISLRRLDSKQPFSYDPNKDIYGGQEPGQHRDLMVAKEITQLTKQAPSLINQGDFDGAEEVLNRVYEIFKGYLKKYRGAKDILDQAKYIIASYNKLATAFTKPESLNLGKAGELLNKAHTIFKEYPDAKEVRDQTTYLIAGYNNLAKAFIKQKNLEKAEEVLNKAYEIFKEYPDARNVRDAARYIIAAYFNLTIAFISKENLDKAEETVNRAYTILEEHREAKGVIDEAQYVIGSSSRLASKLIDKKNFDKAEELLNRAYDIYKKYPDAKNLQHEAIYIIISLNKLATAFMKPESLDLDRAKDTLSKACDLFKKYPNGKGMRKQPEIIMTQIHNLATQSLKPKYLNFDRAEKALNEAYNIFEESLKTYPDAEDIRDDAIYIIGGFHKLATAFMKHKAFDRAEKALNTAYDVFKDYLDAKGIRYEAVYIISGYNNLAKAFIKQNNLEKAEELLNKAYSIFKEYPDAKGVRDEAAYLIGGYNNLVRTYLEPKNLNLNKAEKLLNIAYKIFREYPDAKDVKEEAVYIIRGYKRLFSICEERDELQKALKRFEADVASRPEDIVALNVLAFLYLSMGQAQDAIDTAISALYTKGLATEIYDIASEIIETAKKMAAEIKPVPEEITKPPVQVEVRVEPLKGKAKPKEIELKEKPLERSIRLLNEAMNPENPRPEKVRQLLQQFKSKLEKAKKKGNVPPRLVNAIKSAEDFLSGKKSTGKPRPGSLGRFIEREYGIRYLPFIHAPIFEELGKVGVPYLIYLILSKYNPNMPIFNFAIFAILLVVFGFVYVIIHILNERAPPEDTKGFVNKFKFYYKEVYKPLDSEEKELIFEYPTKAALFGISVAILYEIIPLLLIAIIPATPDIFPILCKLAVLPVSMWKHRKLNEEVSYLKSTGKRLGFASLGSKSGKRDVVTPDESESSGKVKRPLVTLVTRLNSLLITFLCSLLLFLMGMNSTGGASWLVGIGAAIAIFVLFLRTWVPRPDSEISILHNPMRYIWMKSVKLVKDEYKYVKENLKTIGVVYLVLILAGVIINYFTPIKNVFETYHMITLAHPWLTAVIPNAIVIGFLTEGFSQLFLWKKTPFSLRVWRLFYKTLMFAFFGFLFNLYFNVLDGTIPSSGAWPLLKVEIDQILFSAFIFYQIYCAAIILFEYLYKLIFKKHASYIDVTRPFFANWQDKVYQRVLISLSIWVLAHTYNFYFLETAERIIFVIIVAFIYFIIMSIYDRISMSKSLDKPKAPAKLKPTETKQAVIKIDGTEYPVPIEGRRATLEELLSGIEHKGMNALELVNSLSKTHLSGSDIFVNGADYFPNSPISADDIVTIALPSHIKYERICIINEILADRNVNTKIKAFLLRPEALLTLIGTKPACSVRIFKLEVVELFPEIKQLIKDRFDEEVVFIKEEAPTGKDSKKYASMCMFVNMEQVRKIIKNETLFNKEEKEMAKSNDGVIGFLKEMVIVGGYEDARQGLFYGYPREDVLDFMRYEELFKEAGFDSREDMRITDEDVQQKLNEIFADRKDDIKFLIDFTTHAIIESGKDKALIEKFQRIGFDWLSIRPDLRDKFLNRYFEALEFVKLHIDFTPICDAKKAWIRSVMRESMDAYKDGRFSIIVDRTIDVKGRHLTCVTNSKPFDAGSPEMFVTTGCLSCAPITYQTKYEGEVATNHLYHFSIGDESDMLRKRHLRYVDEHFGYIGDRESIIVIPFDKEFEAPYKEISEYILSKHRQSRVLLIRIKSETTTTKAGIVMREGIGINIGKPDAPDYRIPKKGTSRTLAMTWEEIYALLGGKRSVLVDFEKLHTGEDESSSSSKHITKPSTPDMARRAKRPFDEVSDGDTTNPFIIEHIESGRAIEIAEKDETVKRIRLDRSNPRDPPLEELYRFNGTFEKIRKAKNPALLKQILESKENFQIYTENEKANLINIIQHIPLSVILGCVIIGEREDDCIITHTRTGFSKHIHGLDPTIWIGEILLNRMTPEQLAQLLLEESQHILRPYKFVDGKWINLDREYGWEKFWQVIDHDKAFIDSMDTSPVKEEELIKLKQPELRKPSAPDMAKEKLYLEKGISKTELALVLGMLASPLALFTALYWEQIKANWVFITVSALLITAFVVCLKLRGLLHIVITIEEKTSKLAMPKPKLEPVYEPASIIVPIDANTVGIEAAKRVIEVVKKYPDAVIIIPTGVTVAPMYKQLVRAFREDSAIDFSQVKFFNLDEYTGLSPNHPLSYTFYMDKLFYKPLERIDSKRAPKRENRHIAVVKEGETPEEAASRYEKELQQAIKSTGRGKADLAILGVGGAYPAYRKIFKILRKFVCILGGHIGFNEPGSSPESRARVVKLTEKTRFDTKFRFDDLKFRKDYEKGYTTEIPEYAITLGIANILESNEILLLASGEDKAPVMREAYEKEPNPGFPVTYLKLHKNVQWILDNEAAYFLPYVRTPWQVEGPKFKWTKETMIQAVFGVLAQNENLTINDLTESHLGGMGVPGDKIEKFKFREFEGIEAIKACAKEFLSASIHSESNNLLPKKGENVVIFSPHPDDDVITMAATIKMLAARGCKVTIVYLTDGGRAVRDEYKETKRIYKKLEKGFFRDKGRLPYPEEINELKEKARAMTRVPEGKKALRALVGPKYIRNVKRRFLNLPYYNLLGFVDYKPVDERKDVEVVRKLLDKIKPKPDYIFYSAEKDPHGTHGVGTEIIKRALLESKVSRSVKILGYRGAWQEWTLYQKPEDLVIVPFEPKYMKSKIKAICRHGSQKKPLFPGPDPRKFWQRARDRNRLISRILEQLGYLIGKRISLFGKKIWYAEVFRKVSYEEFLGIGKMTPKWVLDKPGEFYREGIKWDLEKPRSLCSLITGINNELGLKISPEDVDTIEIRHDDEFQEGSYWLVLAFDLNLKDGRKIECVAKALRPEIKGDKAEGEITDKLKGYERMRGLRIAPCLYYFKRIQIDGKEIVFKIVERIPRDPSLIDSEILVTKLVNLWYASDDDPQKRWLPQDPFPLNDNMNFFYDEKGKIDARVVDLGNHVTLHSEEALIEYICAHGEIDNPKIIRTIIDRVKKERKSSRSSPYKPASPDMTRRKERSSSKSEGKERKPLVKSSLPTQESDKVRKDAFRDFIRNSKIGEGDKMILRVGPSSQIYVFKNCNTISLIGYKNKLVRVEAKRINRDLISIAVYDIEENKRIYRGSFLHSYNERKIKRRIDGREAKESERRKLSIISLRDHYKFWFTNEIDTKPKEPLDLTAKSEYSVYVFKVRVKDPKKKVHYLNAVVRIPTEYLTKQDGILYRDNVYGRVAEEEGNKVLYVYLNETDKGEEKAIGVYKFEKLNKFIPLREKRKLPREGTNVWYRDVVKGKILAKKKVEAQRKANKIGDKDTIISLWHDRERQKKMYCVSAYVGNDYSPGTIVWLNNIPEERGRIEFVEKKGFSSLDNPGHYEQKIVRRFFDSETLGVYSAHSELIKRSNSFFTARGPRRPPEPLIVSSTKTIARVVSNIDGKKSIAILPYMQKDYLFEFVEDREGRRGIKVYLLDEYNRPYARIREGYYDEKEKVVVWEKPHKTYYLDEKEKEEFAIRMWCLGYALRPDFITGFFRYISRNADKFKSVKKGELSILRHIAKRMKDKERFSVEEIISSLPSDKPIRKLKEQIAKLAGRPLAELEAEAAAAAKKIGAAQLNRLKRDITGTVEEANQNFKRLNNFIEEYLTSEKIYSQILPKSLICLEMAQYALYVLTRDIQFIKREVEKLNSDFDSGLGLLDKNISGQFVDMQNDIPRLEDRLQEVTNEITARFSKKKEDLPMFIEYIKRDRSYLHTYGIKPLPLSRGLIEAAKAERSKTGHEEDNKAQALIANLIPETSKYSWANWILRIPFIGAILPHELSHYIYAKAKGIELEEVNIFSDVVPKKDQPRGPPGAGFYLSGIIVNIFIIAISIIFLNTLRYVPYLTPFLKYLLFANTITFVMEILGYFFLREGDVHKAIAERTASKTALEKVDGKHSLLRKILYPLLIFTVPLLILIGINHCIGQYILNSADELYVAVYSREFLESARQYYESWQTQFAKGVHIDLVNPDFDYPPAAIYFSSATKILGNIIALPFLIISYYIISPTNYAFKKIVSRIKHEKYITKFWHIGCLFLWYGIGALLADRLKWHGVLDYIEGASPSDYIVMTGGILLTVSVYFLIFDVVRGLIRKEIPSKLKSAEPSKTGKQGDVTPDEAKTSDKVKRPLDEKKLEMIQLADDWENYKANESKIMSLACDILGIEDIAQFKSTKPVKPIILAGGKGTRWQKQRQALSGAEREKIAQDKNLVEIDGKPSLIIMLDNILALRNADIQVEKPIIIVSRDNREGIERALTGKYDVEFVIQEEPKGTGHAVLQTKKHLEDFQGDVIVAWASHPTVTQQTLLKSIVIHQAMGDVAMTVPAAIQHRKMWGQGRGLYASLIRDRNGRVIDSWQSHLEKRAVPERGEGDVGIFIVKQEELFPTLEMAHNLLFDEITGRYTKTHILRPAVSDYYDAPGELGFPNEMIRTLAQRRGKLVLGLAMADPREALGIKELGDIAVATRFVRELSNISQSKATPPNSIGSDKVKPNLPEFQPQSVPQAPLDSKHLTGLAEGAVKASSIQHPQKDWRKIFGNDNPIYLEVGCGYSNWIVEEAKRNPDKNYIAIEIDKERGYQIIKAALPNLKIIYDDAKEVIKKIFVSSQIEEIYINFPDLSLISYSIRDKNLLQDLLGVLGEGKKIKIVTEDEIYANSVLKPLCRTIEDNIDVKFTSDIPQNMPKSLASEGKYQAIIYIEITKLLPPVKLQGPKPVEGSPTEPSTVRDPSRRPPKGFEWGMIEDYKIYVAITAICAAVITGILSENLIWAFAVGGGIILINNIVIYIINWKMDRRVIKEFPKTFVPKVMDDLDRELKDILEHLRTKRCIDPKAYKSAFKAAIAQHKKNLLSDVRRSKETKEILDKLLQRYMTKAARDIKKQNKKLIWKEHYNRAKTTVRNAFSKIKEAPLAIVKSLASRAVKIFIYVGFTIRHFIKKAITGIKNYFAERQRQRLEALRTETERRKAQLSPLPRRLFTGIEKLVANKRESRDILETHLIEGMARQEAQLEELLDKSEGRLEKSLQEQQEERDVLLAEFRQKVLDYLTGLTPSQVISTESLWRDINKLLPDKIKGWSKAREEAVMAISHRIAELIQQAIKEIEAIDLTNIYSPEKLEEKVNSLVKEGKIAPAVTELAQVKQVRDRLIEEINKFRHRILDSRLQHVKWDISKGKFETRKERKVAYDKLDEEFKDLPGAKKKIERARMEAIKPTEAEVPEVPVAPEGITIDIEELSKAYDQIKHQYSGFIITKVSEFAAYAIYGYINTISPCREETSLRGYITKIKPIADKKPHDIIIQSVLAFLYLKTFQLQQAKQVANGIKSIRKLHRRIYEIADSIIKAADIISDMDVASDTDELKLISGVTVLAYFHPSIRSIISTYYQKKFEILKRVKPKSKPKLKEEIALPTVEKEVRPKKAPERVKGTLNAGMDRLKDAVDRGNADEVIRLYKIYAPKIEKRWKTASKEYRDTIEKAEKFLPKESDQPSGGMGPQQRERAVQEILRKLPEDVVSLVSLREHISKVHPGIFEETPGMEIPLFKADEQRQEELIRICSKFDEQDFEGQNAKDITKEAKQEILEEIDKVISPLAEKYRRESGLIQKYTAKGTFVPSPYTDTVEMFKEAGLEKGMRYFTLGSGLGNDVFIAAGVFNAVALGIEYDSELYQDSQKALLLLRKKPWLCDARIQLEKGDYLSSEVDLSQYDVLYWYYNEGALPSEGELTNIEALKLKINNTKFKPGTKLIVYGGSEWYGFNRWKKGATKRRAIYYIYEADENGYFTKKRSDSHFEEGTGGIKKITHGAKVVDAWTEILASGGVSTVYEDKHFEKIKAFWEDYFRTLAQSNPHAKILDIGTGNLTVPIIAKGVSDKFDLTGIDTADIKPESIENGEGINFYRTKAQDTGFEDESFNVITGNFALGYTTDENRDIGLTLGELNRILEKGGKGVFVLHHPESVLAEYMKNQKEFISKALSLGVFELIAKYIKTKDPNDLEPLIKIRWALEPEKSKANEMIKGLIFGTVMEQELMKLEPGEPEKTIEAKKSELTVITDFLENGFIFKDENEIKALFEKYGFKVSPAGLLKYEDELLGWAVQVEKARDIDKEVKPPKPNAPDMARSKTLNTIRESSVSSGNNVEYHADTVGFEKIQHVRMVYPLIDRDDISAVAGDPALRHLIAREIGENNKGKAFLSIGVGTGILEEVLINEWGLEGIGVDVVDELIDEAKGRKIPVILASGEKLPFEDNDFDIVILCESIGHMRLQKVLKEAYRVLKPGGAIHITTYLPEVTILSDFGYTLYDIEDILSVMALLGFEDVKRATKDELGYGYYVHLRGKKPDKTDYVQECALGLKKFEETTYKDQPLSELSPEERGQEFLRDLTDPEHLTQNLLEVILSILFSGKKLVLAFNKNMGGFQFNRQLVKRLEALQKEPEFEKLLQNLIIIESFDSSQDLSTQLSQQNVDIEDTENNWIFTFAPSTEKDKLLLKSQIHAVFIDEGGNFNPLIYYYPLFEMITIALVKYHTEYNRGNKFSRGEIYTIFDKLGIDSTDLNIKDIDDKQNYAYLIFTLVPKINRYNIDERIDRYALIKRCINAAA